MYVYVNITQVYFFPYTCSTLKAVSPSKDIFAKLIEQSRSKKYIYVYIHIYFIVNANVAKERKFSIVCMYVCKQKRI
jgi:hypothetical protein